MGDRVRRAAPRWRAPIAASTFVLGSSVALAVVLSAAGAQGTSPYGMLKLGGAIRGTFAFNGACLVTPVPPADGGPRGAKTLSIVVYAPGPFGRQWRLQALTIIDFDLNTASPTVRANLGATRTVGILVGALATNKPGALWQAGWQGSKVGGRFGFGELTMASNGRTGSLTATLTNLSNTVPGPLTASGGWRCARVVQDG